MLNTAALIAILLIMIVLVEKNRPLASAIALNITYVTVSAIQSIVETFTALTLKLMAYVSDLLQSWTQKPRP